MKSYLQRKDLDGYVSRIPTDLVNKLSEETQLSYEEAAEILFALAEIEARSVDRIRDKRDHISNRRKLEIAKELSDIIELIGIDLVCDFIKDCKPYEILNVPIEQLKTWFIQEVGVGTSE